MKKKALIVGVVAVALVLVLLLKPDAAPSPTPDTATTATATVKAESQKSAGVMLFADMREAGSSCGCGTVIDMAREAGQTASVSYSEFDIRKSGEATKRHRVLVNPTVIITGPDGVERSRFEGESADVIGRLSDTLDALAESDAQGKKP